jgi:hypothetical protein
MSRGISGQPWRCEQAYRQQFVVLYAGTVGLSSAHVIVEAADELRAVRMSFSFWSRRDWSADSGHG